MSAGPLVSEPATGSTPTPTPRPRRRRGVRAARAAVVVAVIAVLAVVAGLPVYVFPPAATVDRADLAFVIGPPTVARVDLGEELVAEGVASRMLISVPLTGAQSAEDLSACGDAATACEHPEPATTKGEVLMLRDYEAEHGAGSTVVVTFTPHVARTRYIFEKCSDADVTVVGVDEHLNPFEWAYQYAYQTAAFVKAWATPCAQLDD